MLRLSIIIPVYNVEQYLLRCFDSLYAQGLDENEFEVIVVNDNSPDNSYAIAIEYAKSHSNMMVVSRENGGLSAARNTGIEQARGGYVWFVDSDDFIEQNTIKPLLNYALNENLDVMCFNLQLCFDDGRIEKNNNPSVIGDKVLDGQQFLVSQQMPHTAWSALYRRRFLYEHNLRFLEGILHEDQEFTPRAYCLAKRIAYKDVVVYDYYQRKGSIMKSDRNEERVISFLKICDSLYDFSLCLTQRSVAYSYFMKQIVFIYSQALYYWSLNSAISQNELMDKPYYPLPRVKGMTVKEVIKISLINLSIPLYMFVTRFINGSLKNTQLSTLF